MTRVLIVDDEEDLTFFVKRNLEARGFQVHVCTDSTAALEEAKRFRPEVIILDMMMPQLGGEDIAAQLQEDGDFVNVPIVFLTALVREDETHASGNMIGGQYFVAKPVKIDLLIEVIRKALHQT